MFLPDIWKILRTGILGVRSSALQTVPRLLARAAMPLFPVFKDGKYLDKALPESLHCVGRLFRSFPDYFGLCENKGQGNKGISSRSCAREDGSPAN